MKYLAYLITALSLIAAVDAKPRCNNHRGNQMSAQAKAAKAKKEKERKERDEKNKKINDFLDDMDTNHDGSIHKDEYLAGKNNKDGSLRKFEEANKNHDSYLTKSEIADLLGL